MSRESVEVVREGWDAWLRGDLRGLFRTFDPEVVWDTSHYHDWPEAAYQGIEGVKRFLTEWLAVWDGYEVGLDEIFPAPDGRVVVLFWHRGKGRASGLAMEIAAAQILTVRDGKTTRIDNYEDRGEALEAVGLRE
jgi:ketosteroid isomerase-like protein